MEQAIREKKMAETLMGKKDYRDAREKLVTARNLFPMLDNIVEMIIVCDILCTAECVLPGCETDWYFVLQTNAAADERHIESKYKRLTNLLEPIKNKFPGIESALKLIKDAYSVLSDKEKRSIFDSKRRASWRSYDESVKVLQEPSCPVITSEEREATPQSSSRFKRISSDRPTRSDGMGNSSEVPSKRAIDFSVEQNLTLVSICTKKTRWNEGVGKPPSILGSPMRFDSSRMSPSLLTKPNSFKGSESDFYDFDNNRKESLFEVGQVWATYDEENMPRRYARINRIEYSPFKLIVSWLKPIPISDDEKRWLRVGLPVACGYFELDKTNMVIDGRVFSHFFPRGAIDKLVEIYPQKGEVWALYNNWQPSKWCSYPKTREGCGFQVVEILTVYSKQVGLKVGPLEKVAGLRSTFQRYGSEVSFQVHANNLFRFSHHIPVVRFTGREIDLVSDGMLELDPLAVPQDVIGEQDKATKPLEVGSSSDISNTDKPFEEESSSDISIFDHLPFSSPPVTEPNRGSLAAKWSHKDFTSGHIWAVYDGPDFMPRRYGIVNKVVSGSGVCVTYLEPNPMLDDEIRWVKGNLPFVCGLFKTGRTTLNLGVSQLSHLVKGECSTNKSVHRIYPKKGEVWAMYKNWNIEWKQVDLSGSQYWIVKILSDFSENDQMRIAILIEVKGHTTFFQKRMYDGFEFIRSVSMKEMLSFSHQIPAFIVPGIENHGIPEGCWHLEPDALPPNM